MGDYEIQKAFISHPQILVVCVPSGGVMVLGLNSDELNGPQQLPTVHSSKGHY